MSSLDRSSVPCASRRCAPALSATNHRHRPDHRGRPPAPATPRSAGPTFPRRRRTTRRRRGHVSRGQAPAPTARRAARRSGMIRTRSWVSCHPRASGSGSRGACRRAPASGPRRPTSRRTRCTLPARDPRGSPKRNGDRQCRTWASSGPGSPPRSAGRSRPTRSPTSQRRNATSAQGSTRPLVSLLSFDALRAGPRSRRTNPANSTQPHGTSLPVGRRLVVRWFPGQAPSPGLHTMSLRGTHVRPGETLAPAAPGT